jgi:alpha-tubulin suppressor-like RCC1 family protein
MNTRLHYNLPDFWSLLRIPFLSLFAAGVGLLVSSARASSGTVLVWGTNDSGQLDVPIAAQDNIAAIAAGHSHTLALKADGSIVAWGSGEVDTGVVPDFGQCIVPVAAQNGVIAIAAGEFHSVALKSNGVVVAWGWNGRDQTNVPVVTQNGAMAIDTVLPRTAAVCIFPEAIAVAPRSAEDGTVACPALLSPHTTTAPFVLNATVSDHPDAIAITPP